jgi:hypothetical protein
VDFWFPLARKKPKIGNPLLSSQKYVVLGVFGHSPNISKCPHAKNVIDTASSSKDRGGATMFFGHVNFQPRAFKAQKFYFLQNSP